MGGVIKHWVVLINGEGLISYWVGLINIFGEAINIWVGLIARGRG